MRDALGIETSSQLRGRASYHARSQLVLVAQHLHGWRLQIPDNSEPGQDSHDVIGWIELPPPKALPGTALVGMMIVVPTLAHREQSQQPIVARVVSGDVPLAAANMRERIDAECGVIDEDGAPEEADHEPGPTSDENAKGSHRDRRQDLQFMQPYQFGIRRKVGYFHEVGGVVLSREDPADMTVDEAPLPGRMHVSLGIRMQMVMPMFGSPPQNALLSAALGEEGKDELKQPARRVGPVREVPVIPGPDPKHARPIQNRANCNRLPRDAGRDRREAPNVNQQKRKDLRVHDVVVFANRVDIGRHAQTSQSL